MIEEFKNLTPQEIELMYNAPVLVTILIAGADDEFNHNEIRKAKDLTKFKKVKAREDLLNYYREASQDFEDKLKVMIQRYPDKADRRVDMIADELKQLNDILPRLSKTFAIEFYASLKDMAHKIAAASGGVLGYLSVGYEESRLMDLPMIKDPEIYWNDR